MPRANHSGHDDSTFKPDPPKKVNFYQVLLLFAYHVFLAVFLAYCIYNVWPPQPWPGDAAKAKAEARAEAAKVEQARSGAQPSSQSNQMSPGANPNATNVNSRSVNNTNTATNANIPSSAASNTNAATDVSGLNVHSAGPIGSASLPEGTEPSTDVYGGERPPAFWLFGKKFQPTLEVRLLLLVLLTGAIGSYIHASSSFVDYLGNRTMISSWVWWYLLRPFIGMMLALLFYFVFRGGFITAGVNQGGEAAASFINPFGIAAMAGLVGMFSKVAADKLNEVFLTLFAPKAGEGDAKRVDKLSASIAPVVSAISPNSGPSIGDTSVTITGSDFLDGAGVTFGGAAASAVLFKDATRLTAVTPAHEPGSVDVEVTNPNKLKSVLTAGFTFQAGQGSQLGQGTETVGNRARGDEGNAIGSDAEVDELDGHNVELKLDTADEDLPITEGGVE